MKIKYVVFFLILFATAGYSRERFFEHLNLIMAGVYHGTDFYIEAAIKRPAIMDVFSTWQYPTLYYSKYFFTVIWMSVFYAISYFALKKMTSTPVLIRFLTGTYIVMLVLAALSMVYGYFVNGNLDKDEYTLSRWLMGIAQSPIICLILTASEQLYKKSFNHDTKG
ncbi:MAG: hypothetical protein K0S32_2467 [Bacteroidetes bacterium]|jgi:hypothetical protein|nr:hypothetical protein [Bacteroidota bacterium]